MFRSYDHHQGEKYITTLGTAPIVVVDQMMWVLIRLRNVTIVG
jgi:hypothetical protein